MQRLMTICFVMLLATSALGGWPDYKYTIIAAKHTELTQAKAEALAAKILALGTKHPDHIQDRDAVIQRIIDSAVRCTHTPTGDKWDVLFYSTRHLFGSIIGSRAARRGEVNGQTIPKETLLAYKSQLEAAVANLSVTLDIPSLTIQWYASPAAALTKNNMTVDL